MLLKPKVLKKSNPTKTAATPLWPWFSFIFAALLLAGFVPTAFADNTCNQPTITNGQTQQLCELSQITLKTDIKINGQSTNFVKVGQQDGNFQLEIIVTLVSPATLTLNSTNINISTDPKNPDSDNFVGFGAVATPFDTSKACGNPTSGIFGTGFTYQKCNNSPFNFTQSDNSIHGPVFQAGQTVFDTTYTVSNLSALGITQLNNGTDPNSGINQFYVYPNVVFGHSSGSAVSGSFSTTYSNTYLNGGMGVYAQLFSGTQAQANQTTSQPTACTSTNPNTPTGCVPGYGSTVASGTNVSAGPTVTDKLMQLLNEIVAFVLASIQQLIYGIFFLLVSPVIVAVLGIHAYQDTFVAVIYSGWETVRNLCDIFFIVALIIIAMATLFRVESYKARHLLVQLIIAALLINFSLVIGQSILAIADTAQAQFLPGSVASVNGLAYKLMTTNNSTLMNYLQGQQNANATAVNSSIGGLVASVFWVALSLGSLAVFGAIAAFLVIRIVMLWLLLMISPVAYAVGVLPSTAKYREKWWSEFLKYAFFTPIMAFFLNMAGLMASNATVNAQLQVAANNASVFNGQNGLSNLVVTLGSNILLLVFLIASLEVAKQAGIYGAEGINKLAKQGIFAPFKGAAALSKVGASFGAQKFHKATGIELRPSEWKQAYETYKKKRVAEDKQIGGEKAEERREHGSEFLAKLGSPEDFFRTFLNPKEWKRMAQGGQRAALNAYHEAEHRQEELDSKIGAKKAKELKDKKIKLADKQVRTGRDLARAEVVVDERSEMGQENRKGLLQLIENMRAKQAQLTKNLKPAEAAALKAQIDTLQHAIEAGGSKIAFNPADEVGKAVADMLNSNIKSRAAEIKGIDKTLAAKTVVSDADILKINEEMNKATQTGDRLRSPESYEHRLERLHLETEESSKLRGIDNAEQLQALLVEAIRSKNKFRSAAIMKKMAEDYNDNEFLNLTVRPEIGWDGKRTEKVDPRDGKKKAVSYGSGREGMFDYMHEVMMGKLGMDQQSALQLTDELAYINEKKNHWENARIVKYENGELHAMNEDEHAGAAAVEITKRGPRAWAQENNRLGIGSETQFPDGYRHFKLEKLGKVVAKTNLVQLAKAKQMGFMTASMRRRFIENADVLRKIGVPEDALKELLDVDKSAEQDVSQIVKSL